jgi:hypothetical protein
MATYELRDANIKALALVKQGANRKRFYLRKSASDTALPTSAPTRIVKAADWSAVYCVVAEPGWHEEQGSGDVTGATPLADFDVWTAEEIRKAAHQFMRNGGVINLNHDAQGNPYGQVVENFIAPQDFEVEGELIKAGSWCIAICPTAEGRDLIEKGELAGVSIEGDAIRALVEKAKAPIKNKPGVDNWVERTGGFPKELRNLMEEIKGSSGLTDSQAIARGISVGRKYARGLSADGKGKISSEKAAKWAAIMAKYESQRAEAKGSVKKGSRMHKALQAIAKKVGVDLDSDEFRDELEKGHTFAQILNRRELHEELPGSMRALEEALWNAWYPISHGDDAPTPAEVRADLSTSLEEFGEHMLNLFDGIQAGTIRKSAEEIAAEVATLRPIDQSPQEDTMDATTIANVVKTSLTEALPGALKPLEDRITAIEGVTSDLKKAADEAKTPTLDELQAAQSDLAGKLEEVNSNIAKLAAGDSAQDRGGSDVSPQGDVIETIRKNADPDFAGVLLA